MITEEKRLKKLDVIARLKLYVCKNCDHLKSKHLEAVDTKQVLLCPFRKSSIFEGGQEPTLSVELWGVILDEPLE